MQSKATTPGEYIAELPADRQAAMTKLRATIKKNLPKGFEERMAYGMIGYVVPHKLYPSGYHCDPKLPLGLMWIASQKNFIVLHHLGIYGNKELLDWFTVEYAKAVPTKLDMGKGCVRFKKTENIPYKLIGDLATKISPADWIKLYEKNMQAHKKSKEAK
jgi:uncharacterized protein YdhG (YjbR/CyaY superfamily)